MFYEKIVAVDDDARVLESLRMVLGKHYELITFDGGGKALEYLRKPNSVRLVLVDVVMQDSDGISVLNEIKHINAQTMVIVMTAWGSKEIVLRALQNRADDFIEKPFNVGDLKDKVRTLLNRGSASSGAQISTSQRMKHFVERNFNDVSLKDMAGEVCLSEKYVSRLFKEKNNCSFRDFKIRVKMEKAKEMLRNTASPIHHIAITLGYQNPETFMRIFKRKAGLTPLQYRRSKKSKDK